MKELTHYLFSTGISFVLLSLAHAMSLGPVVLALWLSLSVNYVIDVLGHASRDGRPARTRLTHSLFTAPLWGGAVAAASLAVASRAYAPGPGLAGLVLWTAMGVLVSEEHLFLDGLTQAGVYAWSRRMALAHFRYDNPLLNLGFALLGALLIAVALGS